MKYQSKSASKKRSKKPLLIGLIVVAVLLAAGGAAYGWHWHQHRKAESTDGTSKKTSNINYNPPSPTDNNSNNDRKSNNPSSQTIDNNPNSPAPTFSVTVTGANVDQANKIVHVGTLVNGATSGTCTLTFTQSGQPDVTATNQVTQQNNAYVCPSFAIPFSQFPTGGNWNVSVTVSSNGQQVTGQWQGGSISVSK